MQITRARITTRPAEMRVLMDTFWCLPNIEALVATARFGLRVIHVVQFEVARKVTSCKVINFKLQKGIQNSPPPDLFCANSR